MQKSIHPFRHVALLPAPYARLRFACAPHNRIGAKPIGRRKHNLGAPNSLEKRNELRSLLSDRMQGRGELRDLLAGESEERGGLRDLIRDRLERRAALRELLLDGLERRSELRDLLRAPARLLSEYSGNSRRPDLFLCKRRQHIGKE